LIEEKLDRFRQVSLAVRSSGELAPHPLEIGIEQRRRLDAGGMLAKASLDESSNDNTDTRCRIFHRHISNTRSGHSHVVKEKCKIPFSF